MPVMATGHDANAVQSVSGRTNQHSLITGSQPAAEHHRPIHNGIARPPIVERITSSICSFTTDKQMAKLTETANYPSHENVPERCIQYPPTLPWKKWSSQFISNLHFSSRTVANYFYLKNSLWGMTVNHYGMALTPAKQKFYPTQQKKKQYNSTAGIHLCGLR